MFNSKKIKDVEEKIVLQSKLFDALEERIWILENPPKYKLGQITKTGIVVEVVSNVYPMPYRNLSHWKYIEVRKNSDKKYSIE